MDINGQHRKGALSYDSGNQGCGNPRTLSPKEMMSERSLTPDIPSSEKGHGHAPPSSVNTGRKGPQWSGPWEMLLKMKTNLAPGPGSLSCFTFQTTESASQSWRLFLPTAEAPHGQVWGALVRKVPPCPLSRGWSCDKELLGPTLFRLRRAGNICSKFCFVLFSVGEKRKHEAEEPSTGKAGFDGFLYSPLAHRACAGGNKKNQGRISGRVLVEEAGSEESPVLCVYVAVDNNCFGLL
uniref:Uncharacterized protein n=1 Tax=Myotis myotis TaxID=51298 RepID=A0A7J8AMG2_MYOMY|nr:hypothetical protein mMyoMyo1_008212 [Myotis myotis]